VTLRLFIKANADLVDATLSQRDGGSKLEHGLREILAGGFPDVEIEVGQSGSDGFAALRAELEAGTSELIEWNPDVVLLSIADDVRNLSGQGVAARAATDQVREDLEAVVRILKDTVGAHVLVANASTVDPGDDRFSYFGTTEEPVSLRVQRLDLLVVLVSHDLGISVIDIDRLIAELGGATHVESAMSYGPEACATIAGEVVRILEDYGFLDDRPLLAQVGATGGSR
jgi:hypothetical protein